MSEQENSNAQATSTPPAVPPAATGPNVAELQAQIDELKRQSEGRLRDLQAEREKRKEYEARIAAVSAPAAPAAGEQDEVKKLIDPYIAPVRQAAEAAQRELHEYKVEKAWSIMEKELGKSRKELEADSALQERLLSISNKWGFQGDIVSVTQRTIEMLKLEDAKAKEAERVRNASIAASQPLAGGTPPAPVSTKEYSVDDFNRMPAREFDKLSQSGSFKKVGDKLVYTPR